MLFLGDINPIFEPDQQRWDRNELEIISDINEDYVKKSRKADKYYTELKNKIDLKGLSVLPHQKSIEVIIHDARKLMVEAFEMISNDENPYNYIVSSQENIFSCTLILIISGVIIFILSSFLSD
jgi:hypothetical protein